MYMSMDISRLVQCGSKIFKGGGRVNLPKWMSQHIIKARKRSLGQGNIFAPVCHSVHRGGTWAGTPRAGTHPG